jgi:uncharacterized protein
MKIALSGYRGLIGSTLEEELTKEAHEIIRLKRELLYDHKGNTLISQLSGVDVVIHLSGSPILKRWNEKNRKEIYDSRIATTANLIAAIKALPTEKRPKIFISASAIGIYQSGQVHSENSKNIAGHFAAQVIRDWEQASESLPTNVRRIVFRIGLVIDKNSQLIKQLKLPFMLFAGGPIGNGNQPFPFIHLRDVTGAIRWSLKNENVKGIYNLVSPEQLTNRQFSKKFGQKLNRPSWFPVPKLPLKILFGQAAQLVYESPGVIPERLINEKYPYKYPDIESTLNSFL